MLRRLQRSLIFPRHLLRTDEPAFRDEPGLERWTIESEEGPVEAFFLPAKGKKRAPVVVHCHGNGELIDYWVRPLRPYRAMGVHVLLAEYRGYGRSAGKPSEAAIASDLRALHARIVEHPDIESVILHGRSLGGGAVCTLASTGVPIAAMILESTFTSIPDLVSWAPRRLLSDVFDNLRVLRELDLPVTFLHGRRDEIVPYRHAQRNLEVCRQGELITFECGHNDMPQDAHWWSAVASLVERVSGS